MKDTKFYTEIGFRKHYCRCEMRKPLKKKVFFEMIEKGLIVTQNGKYKATFEGLEYLHSLYIHKAYSEILAIEKLKFEQWVKANPEQYEKNKKVLREILTPQRLSEIIENANAKSK